MYYLSVKLLGLARKISASSEDDELIGAVDNCDLPGALDNCGLPGVVVHCFSERCEQLTLIFN